MSKTIIKVNDQLYVDLEDISVLTRYIATQGQQTHLHLRRCDGKTC